MPLETGVALSLGSNVGDRCSFLEQAVHVLEDFMAITKISSVYESEPLYVTNQPRFLNLVLLANTSLTPLALLRSLKNLEADLGRTPTFRYGPRCIDIDVLFYGDEQIRTAELILPHPRLTERAFVLRPMAEIAPDWAHPETGCSVLELLTVLSDQRIALWGSLDLEHTPKAKESLG